jgi:competence protein ComEC
MAPYTPGFWLSFGAVAAILFAMKDSDGLLGVPTGKELTMHWQDRVRQALIESCRVQAVVTIALLPLTLYWFYQVSIISPLANALAIPLVSYVVTPLAIAGALLPEFIGKWLLLLAHTSMEYAALALNALANWRWAIALSHQPAWWALFISLAGVLIAIRPGPISESRKSRVLGLLLCSTLFITPFGRAIPIGGFQATVFDIGQGTAVLIETAKHKLLYDTGPIQGKKNDAGQRLILPFLRGQGITQIDRLMISHSDSDHIGGAQSLLKEIQFHSMMGSLPSNNPLLTDLSARKVPSIPCRYGQYWAWDGVEFYIWHPDEVNYFTTTQSRKPNEMSCVLEVRNQNTSFWLTGDVEKQGEAEIVERLHSGQLQALQGKELIFMAPHHGSKTSSSLELLKKLEPDLAFAQNGYRNRYGHSHPTVTARYESLQIPFYQTPKTGMQVWKFGVDSKKTSEPQFFRESGLRVWHRSSD